MVAARLCDRGQRHERRALDRGGREWRLDLVAALADEQRQGEWLRHAVRQRAVVGGELTDGFEQLLHLERRRDCDSYVRSGHRRRCPRRSCGIGSRPLDRVHPQTDSESPRTTTGAYYFGSIWSRILFCEGSRTNTPPSASASACGVSAAIRSSSAASGTSTVA